MPAIYLVPVIYGRRDTRYWWSRHGTTPYRLGEKHVEWDGPFKEALDAVTAARETLLKRGLLIEGINPDFVLTPPVQAEYAVWDERLSVHFTVPYDDELAEAVYLERDNPGVAHRLIAAELQVDVDVNHIVPGARRPCPWLLECKQDSAKLRVVRLFKDERLLDFRVPVKIKYCGQEQLSFTGLQTALEARVNLGALYSVEGYSFIEQDLEATTSFGPPPL